MKKEDIAGLVMYLIMVAAAIVYCFTVLNVYYSKAYSFYQNNIGLYILFLIIVLAIGIVSGALLIELGHIIGAKLGGYKIKSVNVLYFNVYKEDEKWKFRFKSFDGLAGETQIVPKTKNAKPTPYLLSASIILAVGIVVLFFVFTMYKDLVRTMMGAIAYGSLTIVVIYAVMLIYNIVPIKLDSKNDGYNLKIIAKKGQKSTFNDMLLAGHDVALGKEIEVKEVKEVNNITATYSLDQVTVLLDKKEYDKAEETIDALLKQNKNISNKIHLRCLATIIYIKVMKNKDDGVDYINKNVDLELRRSLSSDNSMPSIRAYILIAGLVDDSQSECLVSINRVNSAFKSITKERKQSEIDMYNGVIDLVMSVHPKWEIDKYKIN